jgi:hypothetical protein
MLREDVVSKLGQYPSFFIIGAQRSGNTLLRLLLNQHSMLSIPKEAGFLMPYLERNKLDDPRLLSPRERQTLVRYLLQNRQYQKWDLELDVLDPILQTELSLRQAIGFLYWMFAQRHNKKICGDKSPSFIRKLNLLLDIYPDAKLIHIARDGRDVYLSLKKIEEPSAASIAVASLEWRIKLSLIRKSIMKHPHRTVELKYEELLLNPAQTLEKVCDFIGVPFEAEMLDFYQTSEKFVDPRHSELIFRPLDPSNTRKWVKSFTPFELKKYDFFSRKTLRRYGYPVTELRVSFIECISIIAEFIIFLPLRILRIVKIAFNMKVASKFGLAYDHEKDLDIG